MNKRKEAGEWQSHTGQGAAEAAGEQEEIYKHHCLPQAQRMWFAKDIYNNTKPQKPLLQQNLIRNEPGWLRSFIIEIALPSPSSVSSLMSTYWGFCIPHPASLTLLQWNLAAPLLYYLLTAAKLERPMWRDVRHLVSGKAGWSLSTSISPNILHFARSHLQRFFSP